MTHPSRRTQGFTLIEVLVALTIGGTAVAGAAALLFGMSNRVEGIQLAAAVTDLDANGERLLRAFVGSLDLGREGGPPVVGDDHTVALRTWCEQPEGWLGRCVVRVVTDSASGTVRVKDIEWRRGLRRVGLRYLVHARSGGSWTDRWSQMVAPAAIGVILDADTLLLPVWGGG